MISVHRILHGIFGQKKADADQKEFSDRLAALDAVLDDLLLCCCRNDLNQKIKKKRRKKNE